MTSTDSWLRVIGRALISWIFLFSAAGQVTDFAANVKHVAAAGMPVPAAAIVVSILLQSLCGLCILLGFKVRVAALVLFVFLVPTTAVLHAFWIAGAARTQEIQFFKNLAIMGGLLFVASAGSGELSVDALIARRKSKSF